MDECDFAGRYIEFMDSLRIRRPVPSATPSATTCAACGAKIPDDRLKIVPDTELCFDCQDLSESREAAFRRNYR